MNLGEYMMAGAEGKKMKLSNLILMIKGKRIEKKPSAYTHIHTNKYRRSILKWKDQANECKRYGWSGRE